MSQTPSPPSTLHASPGAGTSHQGKNGPSALMHVSGGASTPVMAQGPYTVVQRLFAPVSGQQFGGIRPLETFQGVVVTNLNHSGSSAATPAVPNTMLEVAQVSHSGGGSMLGTPLHRQLSSSGMKYFQRAILTTL